MTQIARSKGLLPGPAIDVYLSNNIAIMQGAVGTPATASCMAKVLALEPEVQQIDNHLVAIGPTRPMAENPGGGQGKTQPDGGQQATGSVATPHAAIAAAGRPVDAAAKSSGGSITITNPATNFATLSYTLDGRAYTIPPGYRQELREDRAWVIQFSRGAEAGPGSILPPVRSVLVYQYGPRVGVVPQQVTMSNRRPTMNDPPLDDTVRARMRGIRRDIDRDLEDVSASAHSMVDWKHYVKTYPWACLATAAVLGFLLVPKRSAATNADAATPSEPVKNGHPVSRFGADRHAQDWSMQLWPPPSASRCARQSLTLAHVSKRSWG